MSIEKLYPEIADKVKGDEKNKDGLPDFWEGLKERMRRGNADGTFANKIRTRQED